MQQQVLGGGLREMPAVAEVLPGAAPIAAGLPLVAAACAECRDLEMCLPSNTSLRRVRVGEDGNGLLNAQGIAAAAFQGAEAVVGVVGDVAKVVACKLEAVLCKFGSNPLVVRSFSQMEILRILSSIGVNSSIGSKLGKAKICEGVYIRQGAYNKTIIIS